ncbi:MAG: hypothetical protein MI748_11575 [Opitutales bacterium]|nr:hypothetical protein [Opitutales bacterium]
MTITLLWCVYVAYGEQTYEFDIEKSNARKSIRLFAKQTSLSIIYNSDDVKGVQTNEVIGSYSPAEALKLLFADTALTYNEDVELGAFAVIRVEETPPEFTPAQSSSNLSEPTNVNPKQHTSTVMNKNKSMLGKLLSGLAGILVAANTPQVVGQEELGDEDIYELSPFVIDTSENVGYLATTTLAGTRVKSNLSDLGSAISVMTEELFADTGSTDAETLLPYALNVEVAGIQGNFADTAETGGGGTGRIRSNVTTRNSQGATRVRGLSSAILSRGLFQTDVPFDSYNTTAITINRGPNSLLFGATTPGGVIDQSLKQALFGKDFGSVTVRIGERKSHREVLDFNKVIVDDRLAMRVALLNDKFNYQQKPTFEHDQRAYVTLNAVLREGKDGAILGRTILRGNIESVRVDSNPPKIIPPGDGFSSWFELPPDDIIQYTGVPFPSWTENYVPKQTLDNRTGQWDLPNLEFAGNRPYFIQPPAIYHQPNLQQPSIGIAGSEHVDGILGRTLWRGNLGLQRVDSFSTTEFYDGQLGYAPGFTVPVIMDRGIWDNQNMSITGDVSYRNYDIDVQNIALEQQFFDGKAGIEVAYDNQQYTNEFYDPFAGGGFDGNGFRGYSVKIDVMEYLANGTPNPNLGRPFMVDIGTPHVQQKVDRETTRMTVFYDLDFTESDGFTKWFGRHVFTGFYSHATIDQQNTQTKIKMIDSPGSPWDLATTVNARINGERRNVPLMVYLGDPVLGSQYQSASDVHLNNYMTIQIPQPGDQLTQWFMPFFAGTPVNTEGAAAPMYEETFGMDSYLHTGNVLRQINESKALSWQSFLFGDNLVGLVGWRDDRFKTIENMTLANSLSKYSDMLSDGRLERGDYDPRRLELAEEGNPDHADDVTSVSNETMTWSLVGHLPEEWIDLPLGADLSFHYNESETFVPGRIRRDANGNTLPPETGETKEYGFTVQLMDNKLSFRFNWYELKQVNATAETSPGGIGILINGFASNWKAAELDGVPFEEALLYGLDSRPTLTPNITSYEEMYDAIFSLIPQTQMDLYNPRLNVDGTGFTLDSLPGRVAVTNAVSEGFEIDVVGNITDSWSVMFNYGQQETVTSDSAPIAGELVFDIWGRIQAAGLDVVTRIPHLAAGGTPTTTFSQYLTSEVNSIVALRAKDGTVSQEQRKHRANLVTTYSFLSDSRLNGFTIGGALRWQSRVATGYEIFIDSEGIQTPILDNPYWGDDELNGDVWLSYKRKINLFNTPLDWKIQLNVRNAIGTDDYITVLTNPDGRAAVVRNPPTQEWFLTNTFSF